MTPVMGDNIQTDKVTIMSFEDKMWYLSGQVDSYVDIRVPKVLIISFPRYKTEKAGYELFKTLFPKATYANNKVGDDRWILRGEGARSFAENMIPYSQLMKESLTIAADVPTYTENPGKMTPIQATNTKTLETKTYENQQILSEVLKVRLGQVRETLQGKYKTCKGHFLKYAQHVITQEEALEKRSNADDAFKRLRAKTYTAELPIELPDSYFSGLFEHNAAINSTENTLRLEMRHNQVAVCRMMAKRFGGHVESCKWSKKSMCSWICEDVCLVRNALETMLPYLLIRRGQVQECLKQCETLTDEYRHTKSYKLIDWGKINEDTRWWIAGQVDSDGCLRASGSSLQVVITKAKTGWMCLEHLHAVLGGDIKAGRSEQGNKQEQKVWTLCGARARDFCDIMKKYVFLKRPQFVLASDFMRSYIEPEKAVEMTAAFENELKRLKRVEHEPIMVPLSIAYMAGFIDGDGCLCVTKGGCCVGIVQKYRAICDAFVATLMIGKTSNCESCFRWTTRTKEGKEFLIKLHPHLVEKKEQARMILEMKPGTHMVVKHQLSLIKSGCLLRHNNAGIRG